MLFNVYEICQVRSEMIKCKLKGTLELIRKKNYNIHLKKKKTRTNVDGSFLQINFIG